MKKQPTFKTLCLASVLGAALALALGNQAVAADDLASLEAAAKKRR